MRQLKIGPSAPATSRVGLTQADQLIALTQDVMMNACRPALELSVPLVVDAKAGATWGEAH